MRYCTPDVDNYRGIIHVIFRNRQYGGYRENDSDKERPQDTGDVDSPSEDTGTHVERPRLEVDLWMIPENAA